ncbi:MAG: hypothetical protein AB7O59_04870 [Pirellulales bacterium]
MSARGTFDAGHRHARRRCASWLVFTLSAMLAPLLPARAAAPAPSASVTITQLRAGFAGHFKVGYWTPFVVTLQGGASPAKGKVELIVADCEGVPSRVHAPAAGTLEVPAGAIVSVPLYAKIGQLQSNVTVAFRAEGAAPVTREFVTREPGPLAAIASSSSQLVVTLGAPLASIDETSFSDRSVRVADVATSNELPAEWWGYEGVDAVVLATGSDSAAAQWTTETPQLAALDRWVRLGGTLVLCAGQNASQVLAAGAPLTRFAPGTLADSVPLRQGTTLETFAESPEPITATGGRFVLQVPKLADVRGTIEAYAGAGPRDLPLVVRTPHGFGEIVFAAFDLERPPISTWSARAQLVDRLLGRAVRRPKAADSDTLGEVTTLGFVDISGQLRGALDQFAEVRLVPFWLVALLVVFYIACIGPLDYFLVRRWFKRMEATWITFALAVLAFSAGAYLLAYQLKGREVHVNRVELVDFDADSGLVRGTSWSNLYSPASQTYDLSLDPAPAVRGLSAAVAGSPTAPPDLATPQSAPAAVPPRSLFSWFGLPGDGFGGMNPSTASMPLFTLTYDFAGALDALEQVPIAVWSTRPFVARWWAEAAPPIVADLSDAGRLAGSLEYRRAQPLEDCVLIYGGWAYPLRTLQPGQRIDIDRELDPQTVQTYLRRVVVRNDRDVAPPYDQASFDVARILEIMSCHELAGGESYTGLANEYQAFVDLSQLVQNGRAILIGREPRCDTQLMSDGRPLVDDTGRQLTFYRFVFPVRSNADR